MLQRERCGDAASCALMPAMLPALWFCRNISPNDPSGKRETVQ